MQYIICIVSLLVGASDSVNVAIIVYDVTKKSSFNNCTKWLERARAQRPEQPFLGVLLANRSYLKTQREISEREGQQLANQNELAFFECYAISCL